VPIPVFDKNQGNIAHAQADIQTAKANELATRLQVDLDVAAAVDEEKRAVTKLHQFEDGGMLARAVSIRAVAEKQWQAGAASLLEVRQAERDYNALRAEYLSDLDDYRTSLIDLAAATNGAVIGNPPPVPVDDPTLTPASQPLGDDPLVDVPDRPKNR
jgi:outer membrane protein TolC